MANLARWLPKFSSLFAQFEPKAHPTPHHRADYDDSSLRLRLLRQLTLISILADCVSVVNFTIIWLISAQPLLMVFALANVLAALATLVSFFMARAGYYKPGCWLLIGGSSIGIAYGFYILGTQVLVIIPVLAVISLSIVLMQSWEAIAISGVWIGFSAAIYVLQDLLHWYSPPLKLSSEFQTFINLVLITAITGVIVALLLIPAKALLRAAQGQNQQLQIALRERQIAQDELHQSEEKLRQAQKMEAIGRLSGGIAHDFNNILTVISGCSDMVLAKLPPHDANRDDIEEISRSAQRAAELTRQLLAFSRKQVLQPRIVNLASVVHDLNKMLTRLLGAEIELVVAIAPGLGLVKIDRSQIEQVVINLVINARDAMPGGGKLFIECANCDLDEQYAARHISVQPGAYVQLKISDTGHGIAAEHLPNIFEPFFTTRPTGRGTGLGLATVYGIIKQSSGNIWVYSEPGVGTTFKVYLPRLLDPAENETAPALPTVSVRTPAPARSVTGAGTILLVEDDASIRRLARRILETEGYRILEAANGQEALQIYEEGHPHIQLVVSDVMMPRMSGPELVSRLQQFQPDLRVLYMSGYTDRTITARDFLDEQVVFVEKPFVSQSLLGKVREVLNPPASSAPPKS